MSGLGLGGVAEGGGDGEGGAVEGGGERHLGGFFWGGMGGCWVVGLVLLLLLLLNRLLSMKFSTRLPSIESALKKRFQ